MQSISISDFFNTYSVEYFDLVRGGLFQWSDLAELRELSGYASGVKKINGYINVLRSVPKHWKYFLKNIDQHILNVFKDVFRAELKTSTPLNSVYPISDYILKASIAKAFNPKVICEIGTYYGWGSASLKIANPSAKVYTINPRITHTANNPISENEIGREFKNRSIDITQIWADSSTFDFSAIAPIDVLYIDGNHDYSFVLKDLTNTSKHVSKLTIVDDYIPSKYSDRGDVRSFGPWNESVTRATDDFLLTKHDYGNAFWLQGTPIGVLLK